MQVHEDPQGEPALGEMWDEHPGQLRGYGFLRYDSAASAAKARLAKPFPLLSPRDFLWPLSMGP